MSNGYAARYDRAVKPAPVFSLNVHASYACRHSGACCNAGWNIPVEPRMQPLIGTAWLVANPDGACPQFDRPSGLCRVHRDHGQSMLPESCHQFPRRALIDGRGTFVTLSHFCPTAAALLLDSAQPLAIVAHPAAFPADRGYEGLDATGEWPPLLRPDLLFDEESLALWERHMVEVVAASLDTVEVTLARLAATGERLRKWTPNQGTLREWTARVLSASPEPLDVDVAARYATFAGTDGFVRAAQSVPDGLDRPGLPDGLMKGNATLVAPVWDALSSVIVRYLGAKAFASWTAYQSRGIRTQIAELFMTAAVLRVECVRACLARAAALSRDSLLDAVRATDLLLVHLADRDTLLTWLGKVETDAPARPRR